MLVQSKRIVGYATLDIYDKVANAIWIGLIPELISQGIGIQFMKDIYSHLKQKSVKEIILTTRNRFKKALTLYIKNGFEIYGMHVGADGDLMKNLKKVDI
jgi:hypothetical protein